jgi:hypothetical protein
VAGERRSGSLRAVLVLWWVLGGVVGLGALTMPALGLWRAGRALAGEVARVGRLLGAAGADLERATRDIPRRSNLGTTHDE